MKSLKITFISVSLEKPRVVEEVERMLEEARAEGYTHILAREGKNYLQLIAAYGPDDTFPELALNERMIDIHKLCGGGSR